MVISHKKIDLWGRTLIETINIKPPYRLSVNFPQQACFIYYKRGKTLINSPTEQVKVSSNESLILDCGTYFADLLEYPDGDFYEILVFHLHAEILQKLYRQEFPTFLKKDGGHSYMQKIASREVINKFTDTLYFYFENPSLINDDILELKVKELILILLQTKNAISIKELLQSLFTPQEVSLKEIVQRHLYSNTSVKDLAELSNLTLATFNRRFYTLFDDTPANYIKTKRLERAKELLRVSKLSISQIAFQTGFNDVPHFSRSFKHLFGITPASSRRRDKNQRSR